MGDLTASPWSVVVAAATPSVASGLWIFWRWWVERADKVRESNLSREQIIQRDIDAQRSALNKEQTELFDRLRSELARKQAELCEMESDRDRGWWLARYWHAQAHTFFRAFRDACHDWANERMWVVLLQRQHPDVSLPTLQEIPRRDEPPMGFEDPLRGKAET